MIRKRRRVGKYGVSPKAERTRGGTLYDSKLEARYADRLALMAKMNLPDDQRPITWKRQVTEPLEVNGKLICKMRVDFLVWFADMHCEWHEVKGYATAEWNIKQKLFRALYPERRYVVIRKV